MGNGGCITVGEGRGRWSDVGEGEDAESSDGAGCGVGEGGSAWSLVGHGAGVRREQGAAERPKPLPFGTSFVALAPVLLLGGSLNAFTNNAS